jgi:hypothetical protein
VAEDALPCVVCGKVLKNTFASAENQPSEGTAFNTYGHYGSTVFDPMNGEYLELNLCDPCLRQAGKQKRVYIGRDKKPVVNPQGRQFGWTRALRNLVYWHEDLPDDTERLVIDTWEEFEACQDEIQFPYTLEQVKNLFFPDDDS